MQPTKVKIVDRFHEGPYGPMLPSMPYYEYSVESDRGGHFESYAPLGSSKARRYLTELALKARVAFENTFGSDAQLTVGDAEV